jgi:hypothetical protein
MPQEQLRMHEKRGKNSKYVQQRIWYEYRRKAGKSTQPIDHYYTYR